MGFLSPTSAICAHTGAVNSLKIHGERGILVSGSSDTSVRIWSLASGANTDTYSLHRGPVRDTALSRDLLFSCSADRSAKCWDMERAVELRSYLGHEAQVNSVSVQGCVLASGSRDSTVKLWDHRAKKEILTIKCGYSVSKVHVSETYVLLATHNTLLLGDRRALDRLSGINAPHKRTIKSFDFSDGIIVSASSDSICISTLGGALFHHASRSLSLYTDVKNVGGTAYISSTTGGIVEMEVKDGSVKRTGIPEEDRSYSLCVDGERHILYSGSANSLIYSYDLGKQGEGRAEQTRYGHPVLPN
jgi:WD40 repeat protein